MLNKEEMKNPMDEFFHHLDTEKNRKWDEVHRGPFWQHLRKWGLDQRLYLGVMREIFHYTGHNAQNQAVVSMNLSSQRLPLMKYALHHAYEEAGHDLMVVRDLSCLGVTEAELRASTPLPETQALVAYLYWVAMRKDPAARLGYSYWAEGAYEHITELTGAMGRDLNLESSQMSFFVEHSTIDKAHLNAVKKIISQTCTTSELRHEVVGVLQTSIHLTGLMLDGVLREHEAASH